jgi:hypothetical protein
MCITKRMKKNVSRADTRNINILDLSNISRQWMLTKCKSDLSFSAFINLDYGLLGYDPEHGGSRFLENMGNSVSDYMMP